MSRADLVVVGGGIIGLATAMAYLERRPGSSVVVVEKEQSLARHQTGHNSGVIHSGIYYRPGSFKARLCRRGCQATKDFCSQHDVATAVPGKLLVATDARELGRLDDLRHRAGRNGISVRRLSSGELREQEPHVRGVAALLVTETGIVDYARMVQAMRSVVERAGGVVQTGVQVSEVRETSKRVEVGAQGRSWPTDRLVCCAGLQSDRLALMCGIEPGMRVLPFRGEYFELPVERRHLVARLIYPVPDPALPFLGVHLTPMVDGGVSVGPNAVLGLAREGYPKGSVNVRDVADLVRFPGFWRVARSQLRTGAVELRNSWSKRRYLAECRRYCPDLGLEDLLPREAGIRAQAVRRDGELVDDFAFARTERTLHVLNAPSPAATAAIPIGELITDRLLGEAGG